MLSVSDKLLLAAYELEEDGHRPFSAEDLVVAAWKKFPDVFGLAGYRNDQGQLRYPNSNRVFAEIMGSKPIRQRGFLTKVGDKMYQLTEGGREYARELLRAGRDSPHEKAALGRDTEVHLKRLLASKVTEKIKNNRLDDITFYDACAFWGITPMSSAVELQGQLANFSKIVSSAREAIQRDRIGSFTHGGPAFGTEDLDRLLEVSRSLESRFQAELDVIRQRKDERKV
jgi:hypothetical protein